MIGHAEPLVFGVQDGNRHPPCFQLLAHHHRQQALRLHRAVRQAPEERLKIRSQSREDGGHKAPKIHGHHRFRIQIRICIQIRQVSVRVELDLQRLLNGIQLSVLHLADAARHRAVEAGGVFQQIAHHGAFA